MQFNRNTIADGDNLYANVESKLFNRDAEVLDYCNTTYDVLDSAITTVNTYSASWLNSKIHGFSAIKVSATNLQNELTFTGGGSFAGTFTINSNSKANTFTAQLINDTVRFSAKDVINDNTFSSYYKEWKKKNTSKTLDLNAVSFNGVDYNKVDKCSYRFASTFDTKMNATSATITNSSCYLFQEYNGGTGNYTVTDESISTNYAASYSSIRVIHNNDNTYGGIGATANTKSISIKGNNVAESLSIAIGRAIAKNYSFACHQSTNTNNYTSANDHSVAINESNANVSSIATYQSTASYSSNAIIQSIAESASYAALGSTARLQSIALQHTYAYDNSVAIWQSSNCSAILSSIAIKGSVADGGGKHIAAIYSTADGAAAGMALIHSTATEGNSGIAVCFSKINGGGNSIAMIDSTCYNNNYAFVMSHGGGSLWGSPYAGFAAVNSYVAEGANSALSIINSTAQNGAQYSIATHSSYVAGTNNGTIACYNSTSYAGALYSTAMYTSTATDGATASLAFSDSWVGHSGPNIGIWYSSAVGSGIAMYLSNNYARTIDGITTYDCYNTISMCMSTHLDLGNDYTRVANAMFSAWNGYNQINSAFYYHANQLTFQAGGYINGIRMKLVINAIQADDMDQHTIYICKV
jgi:hypothetical protein